MLTEEFVCLITTFLFQSGGVFGEDSSLNEIDLEIEAAILETFLFRPNAVPIGVLLVDDFLEDVCAGLFGAVAV